MKKRKFRDELRNEIDLKFRDVEFQLSDLEYVRVQYPDASKLNMVDAIGDMVIKGQVLKTGYSAANTSGSIGRPRLYRVVNGAVFKVKVKKVAAEYATEKVTAGSRLNTAQLSLQDAMSSWV